MSTPYSAAQYLGSQWGIFHAPTKNWCVFGPEARMKKRAGELNAQEMMQSTLEALRTGKAELEKRP